MNKARRLSALSPHRRRSLASGSTVARDLDATERLTVLSEGYLARRALADAEDADHD
jgi:hypothetical protein